MTSPIQSSKPEHAESQQLVMLQLLHVLAIVFVVALFFKKCEDRNVDIPITANTAKVRIVAISPP
jgi:flagellar biogenesis protein FliO